MPPEAIIFFAGSIGLLTLTAALSWFSGYANGFRQGCAAERKEQEK